MKLSVVISTWNRFNLLQQTIGSLFKNTKTKDFEVIVVDDASTDGTKKYLEKLENVNYFCFPERVSISEVKNKGAEMVSFSDYICFCDNDVYFEPNWDEILIKVLEKYSKIGIVGGEKHPHHRILEKRKLDDKYKVFITEQQAGFSLFMRRTDWEKCKPFITTKEGIGGGGEDNNICDTFKRNKYLIASVNPSVILHCGLINHRGIKAAGFEEIELLIKNRPELICS